MNGSDIGENLKGQCKISTEGFLNHEVQIPNIFIRKIGGRSWNVTVMISGDCYKFQPNILRFYTHIWINSTKERGEHMFNAM